MTVVRQRIEVPIPRKRAGSATAHEKGLAKFYDLVYQSFLRHIPFSSPDLRAIVIASPGWVRDAVFEHIVAEATKTGNKALLGARSKFMRIHVSSPHVHSLVEVLKSPEVVISLFEERATN
jgi:protein pelota